TITIQVEDEYGNPVSNAQVQIGERYIAVDAKGLLSFEVNSDENISVSAPGFEEIISSGEEMAKRKKVTLERSELILDQDEMVPLPYMNVNRRHATGSYNVIRGE